MYLGLDSTPKLDCGHDSYENSGHKQSVLESGCQSKINMVQWPSPAHILGDSSQRSWEATHRFYCIKLKHDAWVEKIRDTETRTQSGPGHE